MIKHTKKIYNFWQNLIINFIKKKKSEHWSSIRYLARWEVMQVWNTTLTFLDHMHAKLHRVSTEYHQCINIKQTSFSLTRNPMAPSLSRVIFHFTWCAFFTCSSMLNYIKKNAFPRIIRPRNCLCAHSHLNYFPLYTICFGTWRSKRT